MSRPQLDRKLLLKALLQFAGLFLVVALVAYLFQRPLERGANSFVTHFGLLGLGAGTLLADGFHFPVPPQFYLLAGIARHLPHHQILIAVTIGSLLGGACAYGVGTYLSRLKWIARWLGPAREELAPLVHSHGHWAILIGSLTPLPFSTLCMALGYFHARKHLLAFTLALRIPRLIVFYVLIHAGWHLVT